MTAATPSSEASSCHSTPGSAPASSSAWTVSRSQLLPGKTTTPMRTGISALPCPDPDGRRGRAQGLDGEDLDQRVRQELAGKPLDGRARRCLVVGFDGQLDPPSDTDAGDPLDPEMAEAALDRPTRRIEDPWL